MFFSLLPLGLPGGDQVDGLPPAAIGNALYPKRKVVETALSSIRVFDQSEMSQHVFVVLT